MAEIEANRSNVSAEIEALLSAEKSMRIAGDFSGTTKAVCEILQLCLDDREWTSLNDQIIALSKRPRQFKQAITAMVQQAMQYIDLTPDLDTRISLIQTLISMSSGKGEVDPKLATIKEEQGLVNEAADLMQEITVETIGAMAKTEKIALLLEQVRLCLDSQTYMQAHILSKRISPRVFDIETLKGREGPREESTVVEEAPAGTPTLPELKYIYYDLTIRYHKNHDDYLESCRCYKAIYEIASVKEDPGQWIPILRKVCWYLALAPSDPMQSSLLNSTLAGKNLSDIPKFKLLVKQLATQEVISWTCFWNDVKDEFDHEKNLLGGSLGEKAAEDLRLRVIEHNLLVISKFYSRITLKRLADILCLSIQEAEKYQSDMVVSNALVAKIDRPSGIASFQAAKNNDDILNSWSMNLEKLLDLAEKSCHHIHRDTMAYKTALKI